MPFHLLIRVSVTLMQCCQPYPEETGVLEVFLQLQFTGEKKIKLLVMHKISAVIQSLQE